MKQDTVPSENVVRIDCMRLAVSMAAQDAPDGLATVERAARFLAFCFPPVAAVPPVPNATRGRKPKKK